MKRLFRRQRIAAEMREEMEQHRDARTADLIARGLAPEAAARQARVEFGSVDAHVEEGRAAIGYRPLDELRSDLRFAWRGLRSNPGFALAAIAILALAIGVNGAFFTLYANYALKPLAIRGADRHFSVETFDRKGMNAGGFNVEEIEALRQSSRAEIEGFYTAGTRQVLVLAPAQRHALATAVSGNYFRLLGGHAAQGRTLADSEDREPLAVLSHTGWRRFFPGTSNPVGEKIRVQAVIYTVIGVMPTEFNGTDALMPDFWVGAGMLNALWGKSDEPTRHGISGLLVPGGSFARAQTILSATAARFARPGEEAVARIEVLPHTSVLPESDYLNAAAALVFAMFLMVLLIACANLTNLYLARAAARTHEIAMRLSLGASRWRILRQLLTESTFTALLGAAAGLVLAVIAVRYAHAYAASLSGAAGMTLMPVAVDWRVMLYAAALGLLAGLAFGLLPALEITAPNLSHSVKREHSSFAGRVRPRRMRNVLIGGQVAASLVLLILGGVLWRNIQRLDSVPAGYDLDRVFDVKLERSNAALLSLIEQHPGVAAVTVARRVPLYGRMDADVATVDGRGVSLFHNRVDHRYFAAFTLPVEGRNFTAAEATHRARVAVVSRATARKLWPGAQPLERVFTLPAPAGDGTYEVVGVVPDVVSGWFFEGVDRTMVYLPGAAGQADVDRVMVRSAGDPVATVAALRQLCSRGENATGCEPASLREMSAMQRLPFQIAAAVAGVLGGLALLLTAVGLYSVASYSVVQRRREIGVYLALGASPFQVMRRILREAARCVLAGIAVGLPVCLILSKLAASSVLQIQTFDPRAYLAVPALLVSIAMLACAVPAARALRMDPMRSLREE